MSRIIFNIVDRAIRRLRNRELKLAKAIANNNVIDADKLLQQGADANAKTADKSNVPIIFLIFEKKHFTLPQSKLGDRPHRSYRITAKRSCLQLLLEHGAKTNVRNELGQTPLEIAILWCMPDIVKLLLLYGADPNINDRHGITPLMKTAILAIRDARPTKDKLQIIMHLLDSGAKIDAQTPDGKTALMYATGNSRIEIVELLVSSGASLSICDRQGNKASDIIGRSVTPEQRSYLQKILTQPQLNVLRYKYQEFIPEGDRLLNSIL